MPPSSSSLRPIHVELDQWHRLLLASAHRVLKSRANAKRRKDQSMHDVVTSDLDVNDALAEHLAMVERRESLMHTVHRYMPSAEASAMLSAAFVACQCEWTTETAADVADAGYCCMSLVPTASRLTLIGNTSPADGSAVRTETRHAVAESTWSEFVVAAMTLGMLDTWLDDQVGAWIDHHHHSVLTPLAQLNTASYGAFRASKTLGKLRDTFNRACSLLVRTLLLN